MFKHFYSQCDGWEQDISGKLESTQILALSTILLLSILAVKSWFIEGVRFYLGVHITYKHTSVFGEGVRGAGTSFEYCDISKGALFICIRGNAHRFLEIQLIVFVHI